MRIERAVLVTAPIDRVWNLVTEPGWWIGPREDDDAAVEGNVYLARNDNAGTFPVRAVTLDEPFYAAFQWNCSATNITPHSQNSTLVEFILQREGGDVRVTVTETGFDRISPREDIRTRMLMANVAGWKVELSQLRQRAQRLNEKVAG